MGEREAFRKFLLAEIESRQEKTKSLAGQKADSDGPRSSWSSHVHLDLEQEIAQHEEFIAKCRVILHCLDVTSPSENIGAGSFVSLSIEGSEEKYFVVGDSEKVGGKLGEYFVLSRQSPIGKAIWGKVSGEEVEADVPQGKLSIKILAVA